MMNSRFFSNIVYKPILSIDTFDGAIYYNKEIGIKIVEIRPMVNCRRDQEYGDNFYRLCQIIEPYDPDTEIENVRDLFIGKISNNLIFT